MNSSQLFIVLVIIMFLGLISGEPHYDDGFGGGGYGSRNRGRRGRGYRGRSSGYDDYEPAEFGGDDERDGRPPYKGSRRRSFDNYGPGAAYYSRYNTGKIVDRYQRMTTLSPGPQGRPCPGNFGGCGEQQRG